MKKELSGLFETWDNDPNRGIIGTERNVSFNELASSIISLGPFYYYVIDFTDMSLSNIHPAMEDILGFDVNKVRFQDILEAFHPDDVDYITRMEAFMGQFFHKNVHPSKLMKYKSNYNFRIRLKNGAYALFNHQSLMLTLGPNGGYGKAINIHTRIDHLTDFNNLKLSLIGLDGEPSFLNLSMEEENTPSLRFSPKETEVIRLLGDGFDSEEIADRMFISPHTVKKHRKNILEKSKSKNVAHLIKMCVMQGLV
ncbi:LuxR C-terminal-related transcriptional regulator [Flavobacterium silvaticum]|uniref:Helix-turn-helix transcriptional regulator n=1 Tax=Flavobacterium silvaticum TaxID=1852020 RepID=A0A972FTL2_9FLAO|nr:LuxR C-terminal-related transcriptional regulator [Flavobacterium silvaticum]NMH27350.1 helix-turn-helix transcriptional regulator [Flavobacterium silvaticum]